MKAVHWLPLLCIFIKSIGLKQASNLPLVTDTLSQPSLQLLIYYTVVLIHSLLCPSTLLTRTLGESATRGLPHTLILLV